MNKLLLKYKLYTSFILIGIVLLAILPTSCTCNRSPDTSFNPRGKIVFESRLTGKSEIYTVNLDGSDLRSIAGDGSSNRDPNLAPNGTSIAFVSNRTGPIIGTSIAFISGRTGSYEIYKMDADGSNQTRLTNNWKSFFNPIWSPDNSKIAFSSRSGSEDGIYIMNGDGSQQLLVITGALIHFFEWSPDGSKILFNGYLSNGLNNSIFLVNVDGSGLTNLTNNQNVDEIHPIWSPDGSKIAYVHDMRNYGVEDVAIFVMDADGSNKTRLADNVLSDGSIMWSPDGLKIAFVRYNDGASEDVSTYHTNLYVMNADGTDQTKITHGTTGIRYIETWSSDSRKIYYHVSNNFNKDALVDALYVVDADGTNRTGLLNIEN